MSSVHSHSKVATAKKPTISKTACHEDATTAQNLRLLRAILEPTNDSKAPKTQARRPRAPSKTKNASKSSSSTNAAAPVQACEDTAVVRTPSSPLEQRKVATTVFNSSLKVLSALARQQQLSRVKNEPIAPRQSQEPKRLPLKTASPNKKTIPSRVAATDQEKEDPKLHAECASVALDAIRALHENEDDESAGRKREQGATLLLEKFITLEMKDFSHGQASKIHEQYWKRRKGESLTANKKPKDRIELHTMLLHDPQARKMADFNLICSFQSQVLRLALLEGPSSVTCDLVEAVALEAPGSPASVILWGLEEGLIPVDKAESQLQTLSQALCKLASMGMRVKQPVNSVESFQLLAKAQLIKARAWRIRAQETHLSAELWTTIRRAIQQLLDKGKHLDQAAYHKVMEAFKKLQEGLRKLAYSSEVPLTVQHLLVEFAEINHDTDKTIQFLNAIYSTANNHERLFCLCKLATLYLDQMPYDEATLSCVSNVPSALSDCDSIGLNPTPENLLVLARLRKLCLSRIAAVTSRTGETADTDLKPILLQVLLKMFDFTASQLVRVSEANNKQYQLLHTTILKNIEAVSDVEKYVTSNPEDHLDIYLSTVDRCFDVLKNLIDLQTRDSDDRDFSAINALKLRLSNIYWRAHLCPLVQQNEEYSSIELASRSISGLDSIPLQQLNQAALGPRLEKLASMQSTAGRSEDALTSLNRAVSHYIASGVLTDAVETALSRRSCEVWTDSTSMCFQLARVLRARYATITENGSDQSFSSRLVIRDDIPELHLAVLLEYQVLHVIKNETSSMVVTASVQLAKRVLELVPANQYRIWRVKFLSKFVSRILKGNDLDAQQKGDLNALIEATMCDKSLAENVFLQEFGTALTTLLYLQQWLLMGRGNLDVVESGLQSLEKMTETSSTLEALAEIIDDIECLSNALQAYAVMCLALNENRIRILCLRIKLNLLNCGVSSGTEEADTTHIHLAQCYIRSGEIIAAKRLLSHVAIDAISWNLKFNLLLTLVELRLAASELDETGNILRQAQTHYRTYCFTTNDERKNKQLEHDGLIARAACLASRFAFRKGHLPLAFRFARQAAKITISIWAAVSKRISTPNCSKQDLTVSTLADDLSQLNISSIKAIDITAAKGAVVWPYVDMYVRNLRHMAGMMEHAGQYDDALSFWEKLQNLSASIGQPNFAFPISCSMRLLRVKSGKAQDVAGSHIEVGPERERFNDLDFVAKALFRAELLTANGDLRQAKEVLRQIPDQLNAGVTTLNSQSDRKDLPKSSSKAHRKAGDKAISGVAKRGLKTKKPTTLIPATEVVKVKSTAHLPISFDLLAVEDRRRALFLQLAISDLNNRASYPGFEHLLDHYTGAQFVFHENYEKAKLFIEQASEELCTDSMASLLLESVIAVPSNARVSSRRGRVSFLQAGGDQNTTPNANVPETDAIKPTSEKLHAARQIVEMLIQERQHLCPTDVLHSLFKMEARIDILLATMNRPFTASSTSLVLRASQSKDIALEREKMVSDAETATKDRSALSSWPATDTKHRTTSRTIEPEQLHDLQNSWSIISLVLSEAGDEIILSKIVRGRSPFLIRLPLHRSNEEEGIEEFSYADAQEELTNIIHQANSSSHDTRGSSNKAARSQWHAGREALDKRLQSLLERIEDTWLGGFRGIMSSQSFRPTQVEQFRVTLDQCLDAHLPSRQKNPSSSSRRIQIHDHVLEIFLGIGNPDETILDNDIVDLLYFVVDILQFNGERNAYDEIDWDAMLVKVLDALRTIYQEKPKDSQDQVHTILILDKELEVFPWEALPCLINHPVSRMPSLSAVFDRLALVHAQSADSSAFTIPPTSTDSTSTSENRARGTYILNPSLDLQSTQSLLQPILASNLPSFKAVINHAPDESDFTEYLTSNDILLYFGHGSGAQYIRGRTIRALEKCAVTWLMGCSSAKMTTCGKGESFGMPRWYMLANSMAMVGCLWDVTDREIDRISLSSLVEWGLIDGDDLRVQEALKKRKKKGRKTGRRNENENQGLTTGSTAAAGGEPKRQQRKTLVEAVQKGREASVLRYLCGAAVVVYGVPVVLDR